MTLEQAQAAIAAGQSVVSIGQIDKKTIRWLRRNSSLEEFVYRGFPIPKRGWRQKGVINLADARDALTAIAPPSL